MHEGQRLLLPVLVEQVESAVGGWVFVTISLFCAYFEILKNFKAGGSIGRFKQ